MIYLYDEALVQKLKYWTEKTEVTILGPEETKRTLEILGDESGDKSIKLPLICLRRKGGYQITNPNKKPMTFDGITRDIDAEGNTIQINAIPINIQYQLDIYTRYMKEADVYARDFIFNIINHPTVKIVIPYKSIDYEHNFTMRVQENVEDNSDIPERFFPGQMSRLTLNIDVDDAYLWSIPGRKTLGIETNLKIQSKKGDIIEEELD